MSRNSHDVQLDHHGVLDAAQIAGGASTLGYVPVSNGDGTSTWGAPAAGGASDLITGDDSTFASTLGSWTNSGGTLTRDTTSTYATIAGASLKLVTTASGQYIDLALTGTFQSGHAYTAMVSLLTEETGQWGWDVTLGDIGTDSNVNSWLSTALAGHPYYQQALVQWYPTADRSSGLHLRVARNATGAGTASLHVGLVLLREQTTVDELGLQVTGALVGGGGSLNVESQGDGVMLRTRYYYNMGSIAGVRLDDFGTVRIMGPDKTGGGNPAYIMTGSSDNVYLYGGGNDTPTSLSSAGVDIEVGPDYVGILIAEKDASTIQIFDDASGSYDIELVDQGAHHFKNVAADGGVAIPSRGMLPQYASAPASPVEGQSYYDTALHKARTWDGSAWQAWW